jgi:hypothetical protein
MYTYDDLTEFAAHLRQERTNREQQRDGVELYQFKS